MQAIEVHSAARDRAEYLRRPDLGQLQVPVLVIHGRDDTLVPPANGEMTHAAATGSTLLMLDRMGHNLPAAHWPVIVDAIAANAAKATVPA